MPQGWVRLPQVSAFTNQDLHPVRLGFCFGARLRDGMPRPSEWPARCARLGACMVRIATSRPKQNRFDMSLAVLHSRALDGLSAPEVTVEVHLANGLPSFTLVGLADTEVKEARERVRAALLNSGLDFPFNKRITVNLAPADLPKESGRFDLPIALGILAASGQIDTKAMKGFEFA